MTKDISVLVGSRICHDLISPIGAIGNGVELLALTDGDTSAELELITESVNNANARIRFFRIAFGAASPDQNVGRGETLSILAAVARGGRFTYFWKMEGDKPRQHVRCAFLTLLCLETAMPIGGDIHIDMDEDSWIFSTDASRLNVDAGLWTSLTDPDSNFMHSAAQVQFALLPKALADAGRTLNLTIEDNKITARF